MRTTRATISLTWLITFQFAIFMLSVDPTLGSPREQRFVGRKEFEEFTIGVVRQQEFEEFKQQVNSKLDSILDALAKGRPLVETLQRPQIESGPTVEAEIQGFQAANSTEKLPSLDDQEQFGKEVEYEDTPNHTIFFGTQGGGVKAYSEATSQAYTLVNSTEDIEGVAWNDKNQELYFCSQSNIYVTDKNGTAVQSLFNRTKYGRMNGLALDWITSNLYGVSQDGYIFVCKRAAGALNCAGVLTSEGIHLLGIVLDPNNGTMYWTTDGPSDRGSIMKGNMDGSNAIELLGRLVSPGGIAVDLKSSRLFWTDTLLGKVQSSNLDGTDIQLITWAGLGYGPWGIALPADRIVWGNWLEGSLQCSTKSGQNKETLYNGTHPIQHLTLGTPDPLQTRQNHCEGQSCDTICVLTSTSFRCLP